MICKKCTTKFVPYPPGCHYENIELDTTLCIYCNTEDKHGSLSKLAIDNSDEQSDRTYENRYNDKKIRTFNTGATRDNIEGKLSYIKALSPIALRRYVEYLNSHRLQPDGSMRTFDNWKEGIPQDVYLDSLGRHEMSVWLICHGFEAFDNHGKVNIEDALGGVIFNAIGMLHEIVKERLNNDKKDLKANNE